MKKIIREIINIVLIIFGIFSAGLGLKGFLLPNRLIDGGVTGISMLLSNISGIRLAVLLPLLNLPFIALGYKYIGKKFAIKSALAISGLSLCLVFVKYPIVTPDRLLTAVFGGLFLGAGIGLAMRGGAVLDGTEIAAVLISKNSHLLRIGDVILILNIFVFSAAAFFLGVETALYSILIYFAASKTVDFFIHGIEEYTAVMIVSSRSEEIRQAITRDLGYGVTVYKGQGGLTGTEQDNLFCVVTWLEIGKIKNAAKEIDETVFIVTYSLTSAEGGVVKKTILH